MYQTFTTKIKILKPFIKPFLLLFAIYCLAIFTIVRANYLYIDDTGRAITGYAWDSDFNRFTSSFIGRILSTNTTLIDIAPLTQWLAAALLAVAGLILAYVYCGRRIKHLPLIGASFIGLAPFMLGCLEYRFDSPCMALSILASIAPLLFWHISSKEDSGNTPPPSPMVLS